MYVKNAILQKPITHSLHTFFCFSTCTVHFLCWFIFVVSFKKCNIGHFDYQSHSIIFFSPRKGSSGEAGREVELEDLDEDEPPTS